VRIAVNRERVFPESQNSHDPVVEGLGAGKVAYRDVDMVYSNDFGHGAVAGFRLRLSVTLCTNNQTGCREEIP
jgi:hypothetical protein